jgi:hypothetical protein
VIPELAVLVDRSSAWVGRAVVDIHARAVHTVTLETALALAFVHSWSNVAAVGVSVAIIHVVVVLA